MEKPFFFTKYEPKNRPKNANMAKKKQNLTKNEYSVPSGTRDLLFFSDISWRCRCPNRTLNATKSAL